MQDISVATINTDDLDQKIQLHQSLLNMLNSPDNSLSSLLNLSACQVLITLGIVFRKHFQTCGRLKDIEDAVSHHSDAVVLCQRNGGYEELSTYLNNLGITLCCQSKSLSSSIDVDEAISAHQQAVALTPAGHANKPNHLSNLGNSCLCRFERLGNLVDVDMAISAQQQAVALTPEGHAISATLEPHFNVNLRGY